MRVFLDNIVFSIQQAGGVSVYWYELLTGMRNSGLPVHCLNARPGSANIFEQHIDYSQFTCIKESRIPHRYLRYLPLRYTLPPTAIFHGGYLRVSPQRDVLNILTVHDFAHERKLASRFPRGLANTLQKRYGIRRADGVICISESTKKELLHFFPEVDPLKIKVIHHGLADDFFPLPADEISDVPFDGPFILYVGSRKYYKNFNVALKTMALLPPGFKLVVIGGEPWQKADIATMEQLLPGRYHLLTKVSPAALNRLYNQAFCLLYPSAYEGFGFPPGEAMKAGCPVVTTNAASMPEVVGDAGLLAEEADAAMFAALIRSLENESYRQQLIARGLQRAGTFTWSRSVQETIAFYKERWHHKFSR